MDNQKAKQIFVAIKNDDLKAFDELISSGTDLNVRFGRFPLLSVLYLFESYIILNKYEAYLIPRNDYEPSTEFYEIYAKFKTKAKKSLRLFRGDEIVHPILMLAAIDDRKKIAEKYSRIYKNDEILAKLTKIYQLTNNETVDASSNGFVAPRKKTNFKQKMFMSAIAVLICFVIVFPVFSMVIVSQSKGLGTPSNPIKIESEENFGDAIRKNCKNVVLKKDLTWQDEFDLNKYTGTIDGNNSTIYIDENQIFPLMNNFSGSFVNVNFVIQSTEFEISEDFAFIANEFSGNIDNCSITGNFHFKIDLPESSDVSEGVYVSLFVNHNNGTIFNSRVDADISGENLSGHDTFISCFASINDGDIESCVTAAKTLTTDTIDVAAMAITNNGTIKNSENNFAITQTSDELWNPNTAGIAIENFGNIENCKNNGNITSILTNNTIVNEQANEQFVVYASGIVINNISAIKDCENNGEISCNSKVANNYASGIVCNNTYTITNNELKSGQITGCKNTAAVKAVSESADFDGLICCVGGVAASSCSVVDGCNNSGDIFVSAKSAEVHAGGVSGQNIYPSNTNYQINISNIVNNSHSRGNISVETNQQYALIGGVVGYGNNVMIENSGFIGEIEFNSNLSYIGGVVGYLVSNYAYYFSSVARVENSYSGLTIVDNTTINDEQDENGDDTQVETQVNKFISSITGLLVTNIGGIDFFQNSCLTSNLAVMHYTEVNSNIIYEVDAEGSDTTVYNTLDELLQNLSSRGIG